MTEREALERLRRMLVVAISVGTLLLTLVLVR